MDSTSGVNHACHFLCIQLHTQLSSAAHSDARLSNDIRPLNVDDGSMQQPVIVEPTFQRIGVEDL